MRVQEGPAFGTLLRRYRRDAGLTQEALAERARLSVFTISALERGTNQSPRQETFTLLADALGLAPQERAALETAARVGGALPDAPSPPASIRTAPALVGRRQELALLERHLTGDGPPVLLLAGEPGIGKSRLLHEAAQRAVETGWRVLSGGCQRRGGQEPYAPVLGALQRHIRGQRAVHLRVALQGCAWLVKLLPELADGPIPPLPAWTLPPEQERRLMREAAGRFLGNVAGPVGTLLVLDDLHWAGPDALDLLATLAGAAPEVPLHIIGAYRDTEIQPGDPLAVTVADLGQAGLAARRVLAPLPPAQAAQLLDELLEQAGDTGLALRDEVLRRAGGVPFFLVSWAHGLGLGEVAGEETSLSTEGSAVPWDVTQSVRQRIAALPAAAQHLLGIAAVVGRVAPRDLLVAVAARPDAEIVGAFDVACHSRLLEETAADAYQFPHDVIREVVEADLGTARRRVLHRHVADVLAQWRGEQPIELLAYHYGRSDALDTAVVYLEQAGDRALAHQAHAAAEGHYREAVSILDRLGQAPKAARVQEKLGAVLMTRAHYDAAREALERAAETYCAGGDLESLGRVTARIGWAYAQTGAPEEGVVRVQRLLDTLEASPTGDAASALRSRAQLYVALARLSVVRGRVADELTAAEHAVALAGRIGDERVLAEATGRQGLALLHMGQMAEGLCVLEEAVARAEAVGDLFSLCRALINAAANGYIPRGEFAASRRCVNRAFDLAERFGDPAQSASALSTRGMTALYTGEWVQARRDVDRAVALSRAIGVSWVLRETLRDLADVCLHTGAWAEAQGYLEEAQAPLVECYVRQGRPAAALAALVPLLDDLCPGHIDEPRLLTCLAWAHLDLDATGAAADAVARAITTARWGDQRLALVGALRVQALVALRQARQDAAAQALEEGMALARRMPYPYAEGRLLHVYGQLHAAKGEPAVARARLLDALAIFQRLGAGVDVAQVQQAIAQLVAA